MKTIQILLIATTMLVAVHAQSQTKRDSIYDRNMSLALTQLDSAKTAVQLQSARNLFERISLKYTQEWLPLYYVAYCDVSRVFSDMKSIHNGDLLAESLSRINGLYEYQIADQSEINTLKGYCLTAMIALNPQENGQKYYSEIIRLYEKAMEQNSENPRPIMLLSDFERRLPAFLQSGKRNFEEDKAKAKILFEKESPNIEKPYWGKYFLRSK